MSEIERGFLVLADICLLKNRVARTADYALLTEPALRYMDVDAESAGLIPHGERYEHFGAVACFVGDPTLVATGVPA